MKAKGSISKLVKVGGLLSATALAAVGCSEASGYVYVEPAVVQESGDGLSLIELTDSGARRIGLEVVEVTTQMVDGVERLVVPYSAVTYHFDGTTWTYTNPSELTFTRAPIEIDYIDGPLAVLLDGPDLGTNVVAVGAAELYGVEFGIGK